MRRLEKDDVFANETKNASSRLVPIPDGVVLQGRPL